MTSLNVALAGFGFMGSMHAQIYAQLDGARLVGVADPRTVDVRAKLQKLGLEQISFRAQSASLAQRADGLDFLARTVQSQRAIVAHIDLKTFKTGFASQLEHEKCGVRICIENVWNKFLLSPLEIQRFVAQFGSESVGVYFDVGNVLAFGYPEHWIAILGRQIGRVHLKEYRRAVGSVDGFVEIFSGDVNWADVMSGLRAIGYNGWLTAKMIPPVPFYKFALETLLFNTSRAMDALLALPSSSTHTR